MARPAAVAGDFPRDVQQDAWCRTFARMHGLGCLPKCTAQGALGPKCRSLCWTNRLTSSSQPLLRADLAQVGRSTQREPDQSSILVEMVPHLLRLHPYLATLRGSGSPTWPSSGGDDTRVACSSEERHGRPGRAA